MALGLPRSPSSRRLARGLRAAGVVVGLALGVYMVRGAGFARVAEVVRAAGVWVPMLVLLELGVIGADTFAARALLEGGRGASTRAALPLWLRSSALANVCSVFLPAGRAAGEAARAAALAPVFGTARAAFAGARLQVCSLVGTALASLVLAALCRGLVPAAGALTLLLFGNGVLCTALAGGIFVVAGSRRLAAWLGRLRARFAPNASQKADVERAALPAREAKLARTASVHAVALCTAGRAIQALQYGVAVVAVGGTFTLRSAVTADGIHVVAASGGDLMPNQVGAMEAAYRWFAAPLGFGEAPERALSIAVLMHGVQVGLGLVALIVTQALPRTEAP